MLFIFLLFFFFFNDTATTEIYTLSLHDALPIFLHHLSRFVFGQERWHRWPHVAAGPPADPVGFPQPLPSKAWIRRDFVWSLLLACPNANPHFNTCAP